VLVKKLTVYAPIVSGCASILLLSVYNFTFWHALVAVAPWPLILSAGILVLTLLYAALTLLSFKYIFKPVLVLIFFVAAISAYAMDHFGYIVSADAFQSLLESDPHELFDIFNLTLVASLVLMFILPVTILINLKVRYAKFKTIVLHLFLCVLLMALNLALFSREYPMLVRNNRYLRYYINPVRSVYSLAKYFKIKTFIVKTPQFLELDSNPIRLVSGGKPKLIVLVVGESDRAMNHSLNGYSQDTNPLLAARKDVYSFSKFYSCGTETLISVPCMFSPFSRTEYTQQKGRYTENVLDILQKTNVQVLWRDNDGGCKHVCDRVAVEDFNHVNIQPYCNSFECRDEVLLHNLQDRIDQQHGDKLIVLHKLGNHGPAYFKRYPQRFAKFAPTCDTREIQKCTQQQIINTYNNIILYTDYFLDRVIKQLENNQEKYQTALIYVSDHGESLGENGVYLHAMPYWLAPAEQTHVPFFFWASKDFSVDRKRLLELQHRELSHDHLFHSLLGLFSVQTTVYDSSLDLFAM
jgi:lipid A ethanolaminephosphotransferase